jgi:selenium metabolism protein YedF
MRVVNCKGLICPMPLIETKKAIKESKVGDILVVEVDNDTSFNNLSHFLNDNGLSFNYIKDASTYKFTFEVKELSSKPNEILNLSKTIANKGNYIVVIDSNSMGYGSEDLGKILIKGFINTLDQLENLPLEIICYNSGVTLAVKGSDTSQSLKILESQGVKITLCGTCVDFYGIKESIEVGTISNMLYIAGKLAANYHIVKP